MSQRLKELIKLLKDNNLFKTANAIENILKNNSKYDAPELWEIGGDMDEAGEFEFSSREFISSPEMLASPEIIDAAKRLLSNMDQDLVSIQWHFDNEDPLWQVEAKAKDPTEIPYVEIWEMWEVSSDDIYYDVDEEIEGSNKRLYGEW